MNNIHLILRCPVLIIGNPLIRLCNLLLDSLNFLDVFLFLQGFDRVFDGFYVFADGFKLLKIIRNFPLESVYQIVFIVIRCIAIHLLRTVQILIQCLLSIGYSIAHVLEVKVGQVS